MHVPLVALAIFALVGACGGGGPSGAATPASGQSPAGGTPAGNASLISCNDGGIGTAAEIFDFGFRPTPVTADADLTVTWTNTGDADHTVTFDGGPDCGTLANGETVSVLFPGAGSYAYHCEIHKAMKGTVAVQ